MFENNIPFIPKAYDESYVNYATKVMLGAKVKDFKFAPKKKGYAIKIPVFSYDKFPEIQKELGPEMKSTGETIYLTFISNFSLALIKGSRFVWYQLKVY